MGIYAVTGGSNGIGAKTISILKQKGHETINIDWKRGDIEADLSLPEGSRRPLTSFSASALRTGRPDPLCRHPRLPKRPASDPFRQLFRNHFHYKRRL